MQNLCLQTQFLPEDHTGINLADAVEAALGLWELDAAKQVCLTADNGSNIVRAAEILEWERLSCFGHDLHLSITKAIKDSCCNRALGVCRKIASSFSMSWKRKRELTKAQMNLNIKQHSLVVVSVMVCNVYSLLYAQCIDYWMFCFRIVLPDGAQWQRWCQES